MRYVILGALLAALALPAAADKYDAVRKQVEASMVLTGTIDVDEAGKVVGYSVDKQEAVDAAALQVLALNVSHWRFQPVMVDGKPASARSRMRVRLVASQLEDGDYSVRVKDSDFPPLTPADDTGRWGLKMRQPRYPETPLYLGVSAAVFVVARIGPEGEVQDAAVEQVNLGTIGEEREMAAWRKAFGEASLKAVKASSFKPALSSDKGFQLVRVPYVYEIAGTKTVNRAYGKWSTYVPGPRQPVPWLLGVHAGSPDLLAVGEMQSLAGESGLKHLNPPEGG